MESAVEIRAELINKLMHEIVRRYPYLLAWLEDVQRFGSGRVMERIGLMTFVIVKPENVREEHHRVIHDYEFRERARALIPRDRINDPSPNAVLILAPIV